jgi:hypothetical protein
MNKLFVLRCVAIIVFASSTLLVSCEVSQYRAITKTSSKVQQSKKVPPNALQAISGTWKIVEVFDEFWVARADSFDPDSLLGKTYTISPNCYMFPEINARGLLQLDSPRYEAKELSIDEFYMSAPKIGYPYFLTDSTSIIEITVLDPETNEEWDNPGALFWIIDNQKIITAIGSPPYCEAVRL